MVLKVPPGLRGKRSENGGGGNTNKVRQMGSRVYFGMINVWTSHLEGALGLAIVVI